MVPLTSLWIPILLAAIVVFLASSIIHMATPFHKKDVRGVPNEGEALEAFRRLKIPPGDYCVPHPSSAAGMKDPQFIERMAQGPVVLMTVTLGGSFSMANTLVWWFIYGVVVTVFGAYVASRALGPGAAYLDVFRFVGTTTFMGYALGLPQYSIWYRRNWGTTTRGMIDGLVYGLLTAGVFGWLWPR